MKISDWVTLKNRIEYRGFIVFISNNHQEKNISIRLTSPKELVNKVIMVNEADLILDDFKISSEDLDALIDLSLLKNDKIWFEELSNLKKVKSDYSL